MGTRNITRVVFNNELKVCQYCQWDGYPTGAGRDICDFIRSHDDAHMVERLKHVTLSEVTNEGARVYYTGAPYVEKFDDMRRYEFNARCEVSQAYRAKHKDDTSFMPEHEYTKRRVGELMLDKYGEQLMTAWRIANRDTGSKILGIIYDSDCDLTLWTREYLRENEGDWQIEAIWELDYDSCVLRGNWHDQCRSWTFDELRAMTDEELGDMLSDYEEGGYNS